MMDSWKFLEIKKEVVTTLKSLSFLIVLIGKIQKVLLERKNT